MDFEVKLYVLIREITLSGALSERQVRYNFTAAMITLENQAWLV